MRTLWKRLAILVVVNTGLGGAHVVQAQNAPPPLRRIKVESAPYKIEWDGTTGFFERAPLGSEPGLRWPLTYLHTDPGPKGYSRHLAWFLAREKNDYALLWCYLNDSGREFWCWLYRFSANQLTTIRFNGDYQFTPPDKPRPASPFDPFAISVIPRYNGPDFTFLDWTRRAGKFDRLDIKPVADNLSPDAPARTLTGLQVQPLHDLRVPTGNGWRDTGWRELHAYATDTAKDPFYLILYSNSTRGFVVDLKRALTYTADFGATVRFGSDTTRFGNAEDLVPEPVEIRARRYEPYEVTLPSMQEHANPFTEVLIEADVRTPDGKRLVVPGFWDGGKTWRIRFTPTRVGTWTWRLRSNDPDLHGQQGEVECVADEQIISHLLRVNPSAAYKHHFLKGDDTPFFPSLIIDPIHWEPKAGDRQQAKGESREQGTGNRGPNNQQPATNDQPPATSVELPPSFVAFQKRVDECAALGINRFVGGYIFDPQAFPAGKQTNEGGLPFLENDPDRPNPAYFQWMDKRIAYCNEKGIIPDIGLGSAQKLFATFDDGQLRRIWRYLLARYAAYNVCWNLFRADDGPLTPEVASHIALFGGLTRLYDPHAHPMTTIVTPPVPPAPLKPDPEKTTGDANKNAEDAEKIPANTGNATPNGQTNPPNRSGFNFFQGGGRQRGRGFSRNPGQGGAPPGANTNNPYTTQPSPRKRPTPPPAEPLPPPAPLSGETWVDVISLSGGDLNAVWRNWQVGKPVVVVDAPTADAETARRRLWETRMRGGFWAGTATFRENGTLALDSSETRAAAATARFFQNIRFWRLTPHPEFLGGPQEDPDLRRRRKRLESDAARQKPKSDGTKAEDMPPMPPPADGPIYLLADPAWEYVIYFSKGGGVMLDLLEATGRIRMAWFNPRTGQFTTDETTMGGMFKVFTAPDKNDWVLYLSRR